MSKRSLAVMKYPQAVVTSFDGSNHMATIEVTDHGRKVTLEGDAECTVKTLLKLAKDITHRQHSKYKMEQQRYERMKQLSGYVPQ